MKNKKHQQGVTLIETIVALGILTVGIISALSLMISSISFSQSSEQSIVVVNLAREGIEMTRSIKDLDGFSSLSNDEYIVDANTSGDLELDSSAVSSPISACDKCSLYLYDGRYTHNDNGQLTIFKRLITISSPQSYEKKIISEVYWMERGRVHTFTLESHITDW
ncbi:prepilin-type N-terminal cleavage/methylation domain-containing protein [Patescibacteria group bacterium]|nr:prepilin-type N-terminal cleavage/methylation domain-containing protein [Patescibacteria group bacterium]MBU4482359.1 prepilin-type N-terminal cleavage/methylation domain-containing protein [Patescibacteria group bacterium]